MATTIYTSLADFIRANGGNEYDIELAQEECEGMELGEAIMSRLDYNMILNPEEVTAKVLVEAQYMFKDFVDYCKHDKALIESEGGLADREVARMDIVIATENLDLELQDCLIDLITDKFMNWVATDGTLYI